MMTHGPPMGLLDDSLHGHLGCASLLHALQRCRPRMHCFGHVHEGYGAKWVAWKEDDDEVETVYQKALDKDQLLSWDCLLHDELRERNIVG